MNEGFSAFKAMAMGLGAMFLAAAVVPTSSGHFDPFRTVMKKVLEKRGKGRTTTPTSPTTEPAPTPTPTAPTTTALYPQETTIASNFDINSELVPSWGSGAIAPSGVPDNVGAFRFICSAGQLRYDDPIVYPGQPGKSHLHQFYGNLAADAHSTYQSLRTTGDSSCMSPLNRSAYWMPAMLNGRGQVIRPDWIAIYYKRRPSFDPRCDPSRTAYAEGTCIPLPNGLKFVFGHDMMNPAGPKTGSAYFNCDGAGATSGHYPDIVTAAQFCPVGARLLAVIHAPGCWDGKNLDSPDHRSHVAFAENAWDPTSGGYTRCPSTHPYVIPMFTMQAAYTVDETLDRSGSWEAGKTVTWHLSSDVMPGMAPFKPGTTMHADWWGAWDNQVMAMWTDNCINKLLSCAGGDLGNGKQMKMFAGFSWTANPRLVPVPN